MKAFKGVLLGLGLAACSQDRPAESAYDSRPADGTAVDGSSSDPSLTPASTTGDSRNIREPAPSAATDAPASAVDSTPPRTDTGAVAPATTPAPESPKAASQPDNTNRNERDRGGDTLTPGDQSNSEQDLRITQQIRQAVMADDTLSFTAKNIKIITVGGKVTLRGPVGTAQERSAIEAAARKVAGVTQVDSQIEVKK